MAFDVDSRRRQSAHLLPVKSSMQENTLLAAERVASTTDWAVFRESHAPQVSNDSLTAESLALLHRCSVGSTIVCSVLLRNALADFPPRNRGWRPSGRATGHTGWRIVHQIISRALNQIT